MSILFSSHIFNELKNQQDIVYSYILCVLSGPDGTCGLLHVEFWDKSWDFGGIHLNIVKCDANKSLLNFSKISQNVKKITVKKHTMLITLNYWYCVK